MTTIVLGHNPHPLITLAAKELRRYLYILNHSLPRITSNIPDEGNHILAAIGSDPLLHAYKSSICYDGTIPDSYQISHPQDNGSAIIITGSTPVSVLYAAYRYLELSGIRFYLYGDVIPDAPTVFDPWASSFHICETPHFSIRGFLPFHDFPEGPDWWNQDDYYSILTQLPKLRANFIGMHTYPETPNAPGARTAEPLVWIGRKEDCCQPQKITSSYPVQHFKTNGNSWHYPSVRTGDYPFGMGNIFEKDCYGADYMAGYEEEVYTDEVSDKNLPSDKYNHLFQEYGSLLNHTFTYAHKLEVKTCIGTEVPLRIPELVKERMGIQGKVSASDIQNAYEGIFERIKNTHPLDYYWMWTPEHWTWNGNTEEETRKSLLDFTCAMEAGQNRNIPFSLAVCGWTLGPQEDRGSFDNYFPKSIPFSCINRNVGNDLVEPKFQEIKNRPKWAIPWLEDDHALVSPQLWAGRIRKDAYDALKYGCDGLLGIHWRTRIMAPNSRALMESAWNQEWGSQLTSDRETQRYFDSQDFYEDFCKSEFGEAAGVKAAPLFAQIDCKLPRPSRWSEGPGLIYKNEEDWETVSKDYWFVDQLQQLEPLVTGSGCRERYAYWLHSFLAMKVSAKIGCLFGSFENAVSAVDKEKCLQIYREILSDMKTLNIHLLMCIESPGDMGVICNVTQRSLLPMLNRCKEVMSKWQIQLPKIEECIISNARKLAVPCVRTTLQKGENFCLKLIVIGGCLKNPVLYYRSLGQTSYMTSAFHKQEHWVYRVEIPSDHILADFEYHICLVEGDVSLYYPQNDLHPEQTVIVTEM